MAQQLSLFSNSTAQNQRIDQNTCYFRFLLYWGPSDHLWVDVTHWIRLVGPHRSYVEACFDFAIVGTPEKFPEPYYRGSAADLRRLLQDVCQKADAIFTTLLARLRALHEKQLH